MIAGMIHPNMATMLGLIATDIGVDTGDLQSATRFAVDRSFNAISVDGDTSTNDTVIVMANNVAMKEANVQSLNKDSPDYPVFVQQLTEFSQTLAKLIVRGMCFIFVLSLRVFVYVDHVDGVLTLVPT